MTKKLHLLAPVALLAATVSSYADANTDAIDAIASGATSLFAVVVALGLSILGYRIFKRVIGKF